MVFGAVQLAVLAGAVAIVLGVLSRTADEDAAVEGSGAARAAVAGASFDADRAWRSLRRQVAYGARPAGSPAARRLAGWARDQLPAGRLERVPGGLANVVGTLPGRAPAVVVAAHYDTKDMRGFVGANDGASGVAVVLELARALEGVRRPVDAPELRFVLFDGEETPDDDAPFYSSGLRGSRAYARRHAGDLRAVIVVDMVGDRRLEIPREDSSDPRLWAQLRAAARRKGTLGVFPPATRSTVLDDHTPFLRAGVPAIDVIDFEFPCWHKRCDDLSAVSRQSLDIVGETLADLLARWR